MEVPQTRLTCNCVNGSTSEKNVILPGRCDQQMMPIRYQASSGGLPGHAQRESVGQDRVTARSDCCRITSV